MNLASLLQRYKDASKFDKTVIISIITVIATVVATFIAVATYFGWTPKDKYISNVVFTFSPRVINSAVMHQWSNSVSREAQLMIENRLRNGGNQFYLTDKQVKQLQDEKERNKEYYAVAARHAGTAYVFFKNLGPTNIEKVKSKFTVITKPGEKMTKNYERTIMGPDEGDRMDIKIENGPPNQYFLCISFKGALPFERSLAKYSGTFHTDTEGGGIDKAHLESITSRYFFEPSCN
jgi:hypothetical protein